MQLRRALEQMQGARRPGCFRLNVLLQGSLASFTSMIDRLAGSLPSTPRGYELRSFTCGCVPARSHSGSRRCVHKVMVYAAIMPVT